MMRKTILWFALVGCAFAARLDNLYGAPAPAGASRGGGGDGSFLSTPHQQGQFGGSPANQYLPPQVGQASNQGGYQSVLPLGGSPSGPQAPGQFGFNPQPQQTSLPKPPGIYGGQSSGQSGSFQPATFQQGSYQPSGSGFQQPRTTPIPILRYENINNGDGSYRFDYATGNGIQHREEGYNRKIGPELGEQIVNGGYSYTGPDGKVYSVQYKADAGGFQPVGDHLPTPPPLPQELQEAYNLHAKLYAEAAARPKNPAFQGPQQSYQPQQQQPGQQYGAPQQYRPSAPAQQYGAPQGQFSQQPQYQNTGSTQQQIQGFQSAPANQYLPPTSRQQSFNPNSGYRY
ncbi:pupal cuticle protein 36a-like [Uranotaenia lowii]|uniref:pupal cuticle protein 36a-like n=1 Tax=Uranotaenia lowii TaxID=190385 RepID=UPI00247A252B|nr:pupal cuticle protein 36a-like [Uranotaenia lowii]